MHVRKNAKNVCFSGSRDKIVHARNLVHASFKLEMICTVVTFIVPKTGPIHLMLVDLTAGRQTKALLF